MNIDAILEALLFTSSNRWTVKRLALASGHSVADVEEGLRSLMNRLETSGSGLRVVWQGNDVELVSAPELASIIAKATQAEAQAELTRPSLETLAILAYRGPLTRPELEQIRGVQSSLILRNLAMRGLIDVEDEVRLGQPVYRVSLAFLKHIGVSSVDALPDYETLSHHPTVERVLEELVAEDDSESNESSALTV